MYAPGGKPPKTGSGGKRLRRAKGAYPMKNQTFGIEIEMNHITRERAA